MGARKGRKEEETETDSFSILLILLGVCIESESGSGCGPHLSVSVICAGSGDQGSGDITRTLFLVSEFAHYPAPVTLVIFTRDNDSIQLRPLAVNTES